jgi:hypothetical protein
MENLALNNQKHAEIKNRSLSKDLEMRKQKMAARKKWLAGQNSSRHYPYRLIYHSVFINTLRISACTDALLGGFGLSSMPLTPSRVVLNELATAFAA